MIEKMFKVTITRCLYFDGDTLYEAAEKLKILLQEYGGSAKLTEDENEAGYYIVTYERPETNTECRIRIEKEKRLSDRLEEEERIKYEALKLKFENK